MVNTGKNVKKLGVNLLQVKSLKQSLELEFTGNQWNYLCVINTVWMNLFYTKILIFFIINWQIINCDDKIRSGPLGVQLMSAINEITPSVITVMSDNRSDVSHNEDTHHHINHRTKADALPLRHLAHHHLRLSDGALFKHSLETMPSTRGPTAETASRQSSPPSCICPSQCGLTVN